MKQLLLALFFSSFFSIAAQSKKPFFTGSLNFTFALNKNYTLFNPDDDENFLEFSAMMLRTGMGYQLNKKWSTIFNLGYDYHTRFELQAIPTYGTVRYNISEDGFDSFFTEVSYGKLWRLSNTFENGNYYALGIGAQLSGAKRWHTIIKLDFHRKLINNFKNGRLDSVSLGVGFSFF